MQTVIEKLHSQVLDLSKDEANKDRNEIDILNENVTETWCNRKLHQYDIDILLKLIRKENT